ncbi:TPA: hypothetical protein HA246_00935 [Candidatus Woesearchaeota archaeon]|nr:hypothetical protein [Candidatus Woesearchaeota archaeon]
MRRKPNQLKFLLLFMLILLLFIMLVACDSTKALNIQGDGTSVEKEMQQEVASTQRDYVTLAQDTDQKITPEKSPDN